MSSLTTFEEAACGAAVAAGRLLRERFAQEEAIAVEKKGLHDFVTAVDREAEATVLGYLLERFPDHTVMAEEGSPEAAAADLSLDRRSTGRHDQLHPRRARLRRVDRARGPRGTGRRRDPRPDPRGDLSMPTRGGGAWLNGQARSAAAGPSAARTRRWSRPASPFASCHASIATCVAFEAFIRSTAGIRRAGSASDRSGLHGLRALRRILGDRSLPLGHRRRRADRARGRREGDRCRRRNGHAPRHGDIVAAGESDSTGRCWKSRAPPSAEAGSVGSTRLPACTGT